MSDAREKTPKNSAGDENSGFADRIRRAGERLGEKLVEVIDDAVSGIFAPAPALVPIRRPRGSRSRRR
jgi:hypothetical protein